jgi:hypothetical protein
MGPFTQAVFASKNLFTQDDISKLADMADDQRLQLVRQVNQTDYHASQQTASHGGQRDCLTRRSTDS